MNISTWFLFAAVSIVTAFVPGPAALLAISNSVAWGARRALYGSAGNAAGVFVVSGAASLGLGALLKMSAIAFGALKLAGAAYLIFLGIRQWRNQANMFAQSAGAADITATSAFGIFSNSLLVAITNPKSILFFTALFPQFMSPESANFGLFLLLTTTFSLCTVISNLTYVFLAGCIKPWLSTHARSRIFNRASGLVFVTLGVGVLRLRNAQG